MRVDGDPARFVSALRHQVSAVKSDILMTDVFTLRQQVDASLRQERLMSVLSSFFGLLAVLLSAVGLYGTSLACRSPEDERDRHPPGPGGAPKCGLPGWCSGKALP